MFSVALSVECSHPCQGKGGAPSRTLSGTQLCGVRTFLPRRPKASRATVRPAANTVIIFDARALDLGLQTADVEGACGPKPDAEVWGPTSGAGGMLFCAVHDSPHR